MTLNEFFQTCPSKSRALYREFIWILSEKFALDEAELIAGIVKITQKQQLTLQEWLKLKEQDYPLQYFIGNTEFLNRKFIVKPGVLIPRLETEEIVRWVLQNYIKAPKNILDIGAGSGCMGISLACEYQTTESLTLIEPYQEALKSLEKNIELHCANQKFKTNLVKDFFENYQFTNMFDLIVSNPPYIAFADEDVQAGVYEFEPHEALFGGEKGWEKYLDWVDKSFDNLSPGGLIVFEFSHDQKTVLEDLLKKYQPVFYKDSFGKDRFFVIRKQHG